jgi:DNA segregation ATPase FtsK/SpoIIIE, S-DNA-T family
VASRIVHRPARRTPAPGVQQQRVIEPAPSLGGGGGGGGGSAMQMLLPMVGSVGSVAMMTMGRSGPMVMVGVGLLALTLVGSVGGMLTSRGKGGKDRKNQRTRYLD